MRTGATYFVNFSVLSHQKSEKSRQRQLRKLKKGLTYLKGTRHMKPVLTVNSLSTIIWWINAPHGIHWDCKEHIGMMMLLGKGAYTSISRAQKKNTESSTIFELVGIDDWLSNISWCKYFIEE